MENLEIINRRLLETYGRGIGELPLYRIVWSTSQLEKRFGTFIKETESGIYLGEETCEREVPKYFMWPDFWILEFIQPNISNRELLAKVTYEPLWIFKDKENRPLPYDWDILLILIAAHQGRVIPKTPAQLASEDQEKLEKEQAAYLDELKGEASPFHGKLEKGSREAIVVPNKEFR